ncbi:MAG: TetR/AcrR family transcriptional regulator [Treponema sp.]|nr:TetR/AcrR family transcriptional regulator [Treponema sp.]
MASKWTDETICPRIDKRRKVVQKSSSNNRQVQRTRSWIFEALMILMDEKPYKKITVSDITEKAGIARQTFYHNYDDKDDVVFEYVKNTMHTDLLKIETNQDSKKQNDIVLTFNHTYMVKHRDTLKKILSTADIENRILREVQGLPLSLIKPFKGKLSREEYLIFRYKICYQITGCLRVFLDWFLTDMPLAVDKFVSVLNAMTIPKEVLYRNIPNIVIRISKE